VSHVPGPKAYRKEQRRQDCGPCAECHGTGLLDAEARDVRLGLRDIERFSITTIFFGISAGARIPSSFMRFFASVVR